MDLGVIFSSYLHILPLPFLLLSSLYTLLFLIFGILFIRDGLLFQVSEQKVPLAKIACFFFLLLFVNNHGTGI